MTSALFTAGAQPPAPSSRAGRLEELARALRPGRRRIALAWAAAAFLGLAAVAGGAGITADEAAVLSAARGGAEGDASAPPVLDRGPLAPLLARAADATASRIGLPHRVAVRLPALLAGALLAALLALLGHDLAGPAGALLAPALCLLVPRELVLSATATADGLSAALGLGAIWAYRLAGRTRRRLGASVAAGLLLGLAVAARLDAWIILPVVAVHALLERALRRGSTERSTDAPDGPGGEDGSDDPRAAALEARLHGVPLAVAAMALVAPLVLAAIWPSLLVPPLRTFAAAVPSGAGLPYLGAPLAPPRPPPGYPLLLTALSVPLGILLAEAGGLVHAVARLWRARRPGPPALDAGDELLLLAGAIAPLAAAQTGIAPLLGGVRAWALAFPFLALLGARAILAAARTAWPARARPLAAALALLVLYPAARAVARGWPALGGTWNELAGGAPGAASFGLQRQERGEAAHAILPELEARARPGARVVWLGVAPEAVAVYAADGALRPDLSTVADPADADLAVAVLDGGSRDAEYRTWAAFRTSRPVSGVFVDEVPLVLVYARPGAWR
ncbi:glycosyltransferase family 39 protein [Anaeromyxobacter oryzisoli]|uniref:glycosyltransferase family 39 protein n=1 Tax=Anaeromyxobacter oryzisoli TaxID=2925408 RepID=UPI001F5797F5|nr:glycosyltransferase family 39 protein [Anaeromyxobacter sp. SG63]